MTIGCYRSKTHHDLQELIDHYKTVMDAIFQNGFGARHDSLAASNANRFSWDQACCKAKIVDYRIRILAIGYSSGTLRNRVTGYSMYSFHWALEISALERDRADISRDSLIFTDILADFRFNEPQRQFFRVEMSCTIKQFAGRRRTLLLTPSLYMNLSEKPVILGMSDHFIQASTTVPILHVCWKSLAGVLPYTRIHGLMLGLLLSRLKVVGSIQTLSLHPRLLSKVEGLALCYN